MVAPGARVLQAGLQKMNRVVCVLDSGGGSLFRCPCFRQQTLLLDGHRLVGFEDFRLQCPALVRSLGPLRFGFGDDGSLVGNLIFQCSLFIGDPSGFGFVGKLGVPFLHVCGNIRFGPAEGRRKAGQFNGSGCSPLTMIVSYVAVLSFQAAAGLADDLLPLAGRCLACGTARAGNFFRTAWARATWS